MKIFLKINLMRLAIMLLLLVLFLPLAIAQNQTDIPAASFAEWFRNNLALIGLVVSECMSFLPAKVAGIAKSVWSIMLELTKKKST